MSMTQLGIGIAGLAAVGSLALQMMLPHPVPFVVNEIALVGGVVIQDRTVITDHPAFYAQWAATVEDADTGESLRQCEGSGANSYPPGRKAVHFTLDEWTGRPGCTLASLPPGRYALRASWRWGETFTSSKSEPFEVAQ